MTDFLDEKRNEIDARLKELKPLAEEYERLEAAAAALDGIPNAPMAKTTSPRSARTLAAKTPAKRRSSGNGTGRRGRPKGSGTRGAEALQYIKDQPGITIRELASKMGLKQPNYLYRVVPGLAEDGLIESFKRPSDGKKAWRPKSKVR